MKKLILSMLIALGAIVSTQAQVFDFTCINDVVDNSNDNTFTEVEEGFTADQIAVFIANGFEEVVVRNANSLQRRDIDVYGNNFTFSVQFGSYNYVAPEGTRSGFYDYKVRTGFSSLRYFDTADEIIAEFFVIDASGFSSIDQVSLEGSGFALTGTTYDFVSGGTTHHLYPPINGVYTWEDPETTEGVDGTLAQAIAALTGSNG